MTRVRAFGVETFRALRTRNFRLFFWGQAMSQNGTWMQLVAIDILVLRLTDDGVAVGLATAARFAPMLVLGPWAGVLSDRSDRHRLLLALSLAGTVVAGVFAAMVVTGTATLAWIYVLAGAAGTVTALESPARRAFVADLVEDDETANAVGLNSAMMTGAKVLGPAIAGLLITTVGIGWCFAFNAASFLPQILLFTRMDRSRFRPVRRVVKAKGQLRDGLRYMWAMPELRLPLLLITAIGTLTFNYSVIFPLFAVRDLAGGAGSYTVLLSVMSLGSLAGALSVARRSAIDTRFLARASVALGASVVALASAPTLVAATVLTMPVGAATMLVVSGSTTMVQLTATPAMRGRVLAMLTVVFVGTTPLGGPIVGWMAEHLGARWALALGGVTAAFTGVATLRALGRLESSSRQTAAVVPFEEAPARRPATVLHAPG